MSAVTFGYDFTDNRDEASGGCSFWARQDGLVRVFSRALPDRAADLLDVLGAVYTADRRSKRCFNGAATGQRRISIRMPVSEPELWSSPESEVRLRELLSWVSGDVWAFEFTRQHSVRSKGDRQGFLFGVPLEAPVTVSLFSGGLDSLAGLAYHSLRSPGGSRILVSGCTHNRLATQQVAQVKGIRTAWAWGLPVASEGVRHVAVPFGVDAERPSQEEKGQRTRALLFLAMGVTTALQAQTDTLYVFENGIGALNLPLNGSQLGIDNYRGVHPRTLGMAETLFGSILGERVSIENPFTFTTKAEMCRALAAAGLGGVVRETVSCDGYPQRVRGRSQCGCCTSCVLRRQALRCSGLADNDPSCAYRYDIFGGLANLGPEEVHGFAVMSEQVCRINGCLASDKPWQKLAAAYPEMARTVAELAARPDAAAKEDLAAGFVELFRNHVREWNEFASEVAVAG